MTRLLYDNRRLLALVCAVITVAGLSSLAVLPRLEDPVLTQRAAIVNTLYPGAPPERVEALVTDKIEEEIQEIPEVKEVRSTSRTGVSTVTIELRDDVYEAAEVWSRVRDKINDAEPLLPAEALAPDFDLLEVTAYAKIVALAWDAPVETNYAVLLRLAEELEQRLRAVPGTREVDTFGHPTEEITVEVDGAELASIGLTPQDVAQQLASSDAKAAAGLVRGDRGSLLVEVDSQLDTIHRLASTPVRYAAGGGDGGPDAGRIVSLDAIADVRKGIADPPRRLAIVDGKPAVVLGVLVRADQRIDQWHSRATSVVEEFAATLPPAVRLTPVFDQSGYVQARLESLGWNLLASAAAVILVIWWIMGWRSSIAVGVALPLTSLIVLAAMRWLGIPIHQMSVTGLIIALGLLIDNAIVMTDEVADWITGGSTPGEAVSAAVKHLAVPLFGSTFTTVLSFAPIALMPGPAGEFVGAIAVGVMLAVGASLLLAVTVTPAMSALLLPRGREVGRPWWVSGLSSERLARWYRGLVGAAMRRPLLSIAVSTAPALIGFGLATTLNEQFFPPAERDQFQVQVDLPAGASIGETRRLVERATRVLTDHPRITGVDWFLGESAPSFYYNLLANKSGVPQYAQGIVQMDRIEGYREVIRQMQQRLDAELPEGRFLVRQLEQGPPFDAPIEVRLFGPDLDTLESLGVEVRRLLAETPHVTHSLSDLSESAPKLDLAIDESQARLAGLSNLAIAEQLNATLEGAVGGSILEETENLPVRVRVAGPDRGNLTRVASTDLVGRAADGATTRTPLAALGTMAMGPERSAIPRLNSERMNEVRAYVTAGVLASSVQKDFQRRLAESGVVVPAGYRLEYGGEGSKRDDAVGNLLSSVAVLMVIMAATLVLSFGSFRLAGVIGVVAALSIGLALGALAIAGYPFGFTAIIGAMGLVGVAINDSIVVLAALQEDEQARVGDPQATTEVVLHSTRHVLATTITTIVGFVPLIAGGGGFWPPMAVSIAGGVAGATVLAHFFVPPAHLLLRRGLRAAA
jgi:multidrug efflux pump subunit AcrB